jgi:hypothetical protein
LLLTKKELFLQKKIKIIMARVKNKKELLRIKHLKEPYLSLAIKNQKHFKGVIDVDAYLSTAFFWHKTLEGKSFWNNVNLNKNPIIYK